MMLRGCACSRTRVRTRAIISGAFRSTAIAMRRRSRSIRPFRAMELLAVMPELNPAIVRVVYPGVAARLLLASATRRRRPTILAIGTVERRKNLEALIETLPTLGRGAVGLGGTLHAAIKMSARHSRDSLGVRGSGGVSRLRSARRIARVVRARGGHRRAVALRRLRLRSGAGDVRRRTGHGVGPGVVAGDRRRGCAGCCRSTIYKRGSKRSAPRYAAKTMRVRRPDALRRSNALPGAKARARCARPTKWRSAPER